MTQLFSTNSDKCSKGKDADRLDSKELVRYAKVIKADIRKKIDALQSLSTKVDEIINMPTGKYPSDKIWEKIVEIKSLVSEA